MQNTKRSVGLHVRLYQNLADVISSVQHMQLSVVQSFLLDEKGLYVQLSDDIIKEFVHAKQKLNFLYFVHAAYWSNLSRKNSKEFLSLCKEAQIAQSLESQGIVVHIGATRARLEKWDQVRFVAESVNELLHKVSGVTLFLENSPHAGRNFGGDITDFALLFEHIEHKDRVKFCLDTAHAFVFGYELTNDMKYKEFINLVTEMITPAHMGLLHLNDAAEQCGSYIDKHGIIGTGYLGQSVLKKIMDEPLCQELPIILELPGSCLKEQEVSVLHEVVSW